MEFTELNLDERLLKGIEAAGYVKREKDTYDQRHVYVTATEAGKELKEKIGRRYSMFTDHLSLDGDKIEELLDVLKLIDSDLNKPKITQQ